MSDHTIGMRSGSYSGVILVIVCRGKGGKCYLTLVNTPVDASDGNVFEEN